MKKIIFVIFLITFSFLLSCDNKDEKKNVQIKHENELNQFYGKINNSKFSLEEKLKLNDSAVRTITKEIKKTDLKNLNDFINVYFDLGAWEKYKDTSRKLLIYSLKHEDSLYVGLALRYIGNYHYNLKNLDSTFYYYTRSEKLFNKLKDKENSAVILLKKGIVQLEINDFLGSDLSLRKAYNLFKDTDEYQKLYATLNTLGSVSVELKEYSRAIYYYNQALSVIKKGKLNNHECQESNCLNNLGLLYNELKDYKKSIYYYKLALKDENLIKENPRLYSIIIDNLAYSKLKSNQLSDLPQLFFKSLEKKDKLKDLNSITVVNIHLSEYFANIKDTLNAVYYSDKAISYAKKLNIPLYKIAAYKQASNVNKSKSLNYSEYYIKLNDSLQMIERTSKDRFARIELETEEILQQKDSLEQKNRSILNYFIGTIAIGALLFFMRAQRAKSRELLLRQAQQRANEDIYKLIISQQNKLEEGRVLEKTRIAKELHDGVLGRLFGLRLNLDGLNHRDDDAAIQERIRCLEELKIIEQDLREISHELSREKYVLVNNFVAIVNNLLEEQAKINPAKLNALIGENVDWDLLSNTTKINLYRILQECLQNINKYANAKNIKVEFRKDKKGNLVLNITDDGDGFEVDKKSRGIGLKNIVTRTHESDGIIEIKSAPGKGTRISITVPLEHKNIKH
ncbi:ATP-binding protein [Flavobacterium stagni]|uniref:histidine kinase n=1 Tax=Flavobacterium stagni TaxID=2506421 RepID=A0A4Q1KEN3_9FLAO|nr:tetratricopeptide repeat-containing sensor histidine kinase [Flavobacterium stagni]RXR24178.1 tetratricopeptide repeat-containing sensor histidine kinase [Flavobacterium stagni]